jgi:septation ring formation regulator EzrA
MPKQKKTIKAAEKALGKARVAVTDATRAVRKLDKKTRRKAEALRQELRDAEKSARKSVKRADAAKTLKAQRVTVQRISVPPDSQPRVAGSDHPSSAAMPTYRELREQAKSKKIPGYSRMDKAALTAALATHP